jgi:GLPGLI family protein
MKKYLVCISLFLASQMYAQVKEGFIRYSMKMDKKGADELFNQMMGLSETKMYFKKGKSLAITTTPLTTMRILNDEKGLLMLTEAGEHKIFMRKTRQEIEQARLRRLEKMPKSRVSIVYTNEKKKILGYDCTKAVIQYPDAHEKENKFIVWYTTAIDNPPNPNQAYPDELARIKGLPLEFDMEKNGMKMQMTVKEISLKPVPDAVFVLSTAGYIERVPKDPKKPTR